MTLPLLGKRSGTELHPQPYGNLSGLHVFSAHKTKADMGEQTVNAQGISHSEGRPFLYPRFPLPFLGQPPI